MKNSYHMQGVTQSEIPDWAILRAKSIAQCGWSLHELRTKADSAHFDSYVFTIFKIAQHVMATEKKPVDPVFNTVNETIHTSLSGVDLSETRNWPGTVKIAENVVEALRRRGFLADHPDDLSDALKDILICALAWDTTKMDVADKLHGLLDELGGAKVLGPVKAAS